MLNTEDLFKYKAVPNVQEDKAATSSTVEQVTNAGKPNPKESLELQSLKSESRAFFDKNTSNMSSDEKGKFAKLLSFIGNQDSAALSTQMEKGLPLNEHLVLPESIVEKMKSIRDDEIGTAHTLEELEWFDIIHLNALSISNGVAYEDVKKHHWIMAMIRANCVKYGLAALDEDGKIRGTTISEVRILPNPGVDYDELFTHIAPFEKLIDDINIYALYAPIMANHMRMKTGHAYADDSYDAIYSKLISACMINDLTVNVQCKYLFYNTIHWIGFKNIRYLFGNLETANALPAALILRKDTPPIGTALIGTSRVVIDHITRAGAFPEISKLFATDIANVRRADDDIKRDVYAYAINYKQYGYNVNMRDNSMFKDAVISARNIACICQSYLDTINKGTNIAKAKVLKGPAEDNIFLRRQLVQYFKKISEKLGDQKTLKEIIQLDIENRGKAPAHVAKKRTS